MTGTAILSSSRTPDIAAGQSAMSVVLQWLSCVPDAGGAAKPENNS
jgi:hypothetical protein